MKHATDRSPAIWRLSIRLIPLLFTAIQAVAAPAEHGDISGTWQLTVVGPDGTNFERIQLKADGDKISGKHGQSGNLEGTLKADRLEIKEYGDDKKLRIAFGTGHFSDEKHQFCNLQFSDTQNLRRICFATLKYSIV